MTGLATSSGPTLLGKLRALEAQMRDCSSWDRGTAQTDLAGLLPAIITALSAAPANEDANNYCRILSLLGMEEEGDPVAEVERNAADASLLDWFDAACREEHPNTPYLDGARWVFPYEVSNAGGHGGGVGLKSFDTLREALNAAKERT